ncbi:EpsG family protein [Enterococcus hailinensis]|uniref:EpsG family protein n=1 Tax=Enterococcus hailinensis TaxID=3238988 RepID=UPI0038B3471E
MGIYLGIISIFTFTIWAKEKININNIYTRKVVALIAMLEISIFSGIRNLYVGIDIGTYGNLIFNSVVNFGIKSTLVNYKRWADIGYVFLNYLVSFFTSNIHMLLGVQTFIIQLSFFLFFNSINKKKFSLPLALALTNILFLPFSFSMLRQSLAIAIVIWIPKLIFEKKYINFLLFSYIGYSLHKSSILAIIFYVSICLIVNKTKKYYAIQASLVAGILAIFFLAVIKFFPQSVLYFSNLLNVAIFNSSNTLSLIRFLLFLFPILLLGIINNKKFITGRRDYSMFLFSLILVILNLISGINFGIFRFSFFFFPIYITFIILQIGKIEKNITKKIISLIIVIWIILCLYLLIYRENMGGIFPYVTYWKTYNPTWINDLGSWVDKTKFYNLYN